MRTNVCMGVSRKKCIPKNCIKKRGKTCIYVILYKTNRINNHQFRLIFSTYMIESKDTNLFNEVGETMFLFHLWRNPIQF